MYNYWNRLNKWEDKANAKELTWAYCSVWLSNLTEESYFGDLANHYLQSPDMMLGGSSISTFLISDCNGNYKVAHGNIMLINETYLNVIEFKPSTE